MGVHFACAKKFGKGSARAERRQGSSKILPTVVHSSTIEDSSTRMGVLTEPFETLAVLNFLLIRRGLRRGRWLFQILFTLRDLSAWSV
jgi:hypothetical protein